MLEDHSQIKTKNKLRVPLAAHKKGMNEFNDTLEVNHPGRDKTMKAIKTQFIWPKMYKDVRDDVASCFSCATTKKCFF